MPVVVVESPAKAKTINKYLGSNYTVLASYGHVRDLPPKDGSVNPDDNFAMTWEVAADSRKHIKAITDALADPAVHAGLEANSQLVAKPLSLAAVSKAYADGTAQFRAIAKSINLQPQ